MSADLKAETKRAYDAAAEALCDHVYACPNCHMTGPICETGQPLAEAENSAWDAYQRAKQ